MIHLLCDNTGSGLVEFAFSAVILLALMFGIMDFSRAMYCYHYVTYAAQDGARYAMVRGADSSLNYCPTTGAFACNASDSDVQAHIKGQAYPLIDPNNLTVNTTWPGTTLSCTKNCTECSPANNQGCLVKVQVKYDFSFILPFLPRNAGLTFVGTSEKVIQ